MGKASVKGNGAVPRPARKDGPGAYWDKQCARLEQRTPGGKVFRPIVWRVGIARFEARLQNRRGKVILLCRTGDFHEAWASIQDAVASGEFKPLRWR